METNNTFVSWPFGEAEIQTPAYAATLEVTVKNQLTIVDVATLSGAITINLAIDDQVRAGALLQLQLTSDATARTATLGTGFLALAISGTISKTKVANFMYDGTQFVPVGAAVQVD